MIHINNDWKIQTDGCYTLVKLNGSKIDPKTKEKVPAYKVYGYYNTLEDLLVGYVRDKSLDEMVDKDLTVSEAINIIKSNCDEIRQIIRSETVG